MQAPPPPPPPISPPERPDPDAPAPIGDPPEPAPQPEPYVHRQVRCTPRPDMAVGGAVEGAELVEELRA